MLTGTLAAEGSDVSQTEAGDGADSDVTGSHAVRLSAATTAARSGPKDRRSPNISQQ